MSDSLITALAAVQADLPRVAKDNTAKVKSEKGSYTYRYADLAEITPVLLPLLNRNGLVWTTCPTVTEEGRFVLRYALTHTSGESTGGDYPLPKPDSAPQVLGSAITYARRYALCAVTGVAPGGDDDDAAEAQRSRRTEDEVPFTEPVVDEANEVRKRMRSVGEKKGWTKEEIVEDFVARTQGVHPRDARLVELQAYLSWLEKQPDKWESA